MSSEDWKDSFYWRVLDRGLSLCLDGSVGPLVRTENGYRATVQGSRDYSVEIMLDDEGNFVDATCTCPYANGDEQFCKHEAAVLYQIFGDEEEGIEPHPQDPAPVPCDEVLDLLEEQLGHIDVDEARSLLLEAARQSETVRSSLIAHFSSSSRALLEIRVNEALSKAIYNDSMLELYNIAAGQLAPLVSREPLLAFTLAMNVLAKGREISGSLVGMGQDLMLDYAHAMAEILDRIWNSADNGQKEDIVCALKGMLGFYRFDAVSFSFMVDTIKDASLTGELLSCVRQVRGIFSVDDRLWALERLGVDRDQRIEILKASNDHASIMRLVAMLEKAGRWQECLDAIERFYDGDIRSMSSGYRDKYVGICKAQGYTERLKQLLLQEIEAPCWNAIVKAREYLSLVDGDSKAEEIQRLLKYSSLARDREELVSMSPDPLVKMEYLEEVDDINVTSRFVGSLAVGKCRGRLLSLMERQLDRLEAGMHTRAEYRVYAELLHQLSRLKNNREWGHAKVAAIRIKYPTRKALLEETAWLLPEED